MNSRAHVAYSSLVINANSKRFSADVARVETGVMADAARRMWWLLDLYQRC